MASFWERIRNWFSPSRRPPRPAAPPRDVDADELNLARARDSLGRVLTIWGREAFDMDRTPADDTRAGFEGWARHVTLGSPPPGMPHIRTARHWDGLQEFVADHRQEEKLFVERSQRDLRDALWSFVRSLGETLAVDRRSDAEFNGHLSRLKESVEKQSTEDIKRTVLAVAGDLSRILSQRRERQAAQMSSLSERMKHLREELEETRKNLEIDPLTKLYNRKALDDQLERVIAVSVIMGHTTCVAMIDLDHFKAINDTYGHPAGDKVLKAVGNILVDAFPRRTDFVARYGGEEFAILFQQDSMRIAHPLIDRMMRMLRETTIEYEGQAIEIRASVGLAEWVTGETPEAWIARADRALYRAKEAGRDRVMEAMAIEDETEPCLR